MEDQTILKIWGMTMLLLGYFMAAMQGYNGWLFTTVMVILAAAMGLEVGLVKGVNMGERKN